MKIGRRELFKALTGACAAAGITSAQTITVEPNEVLILRHPSHTFMTKEHVELLTKQMQDAFPGHRVLVMEEGWRLDSMSKLLQDGSISINEARQAMDLMLPDGNVNTETIGELIQKHKQIG
jgi:hypothetical protein